MRVLLLLLLVIEVNAKSYNKHCKVVTTNGKKAFVCKSATEWGIDAKELSHRTIVRKVVKDKGGK